MKNPTIYSFSVVYSSFGEFVNKTPYIVAILEREDQSRFPYLLQNVDGVDIKIGQEVELGRSTR